MQLFHREDTIVALASPAGTGALGVIRISGPQTLYVVQCLCAKAKVANWASHQAKLARIFDGERVVDEAVVTLFKGPKSFTCEDTAELSLHGSPYILEQVIRLCLRAGARLAEPGEFTFRAFVNGRFDLSQAEAIADLIAADNEHAHRVAMNQMRGGFADEIKALREQLIHFASLLELELDFGEEDVEFADRRQLLALLAHIRQVVAHLRSSFQRGNVIKHGVATVIAGKPNAGKSTLLNALLNEEKAIVSPIPGTTRDVIEDTIMLGGVKFRLIDTAGLREATDVIEQIGVERTKEKLKQAAVVVYLFDVVESTVESVKQEMEGLQTGDTPLVLVANKADLLTNATQAAAWKEAFPHMMLLAAKAGDGLAALEARLLEVVHANGLQQDKLVANARHEQALGRATESLLSVEAGLTGGISSELVAQDIRRTLHFLGEITGEVSTDDLLGNIFSKFCIGK
ncbi:MAG: tRNA uridine-5-carboxymethylaminomethyl(34) synthesis GTPase MnmE [Sphingobacteriaceae bacterium]|nr:tRNA uridine-5-carboxymethylaminomethyl(34) synthesis GTPase MnmE [Sphingobacteriaceae bacterium]